MIGRNAVTFDAHLWTTPTAVPKLTPMCMACQQLTQADMEYLAKLAAEAKAKAETEAAPADDATPAVTEVTPR